MIGLFISFLPALLLVLGFIWTIFFEGPEPVGREQALRAAVELHRIRRQVDADQAKAAIRINAREIERQGLRELDDEP